MFLVILSNAFVIAGLIILSSATLPLRKLIGLLPDGPIRRKWYGQSLLIFIFILGYLWYLLNYWWEGTMVVPTVFLFGSVFVWLTIHLSLQTARDVRRVVRLEEENITDPLIGIYNRRYLDQRLEEEFRRARRFDLPLSLLLIDIDFFKQVNDSYGHPVGDIVLRHWGGLILSAVRASDVVARYGGDEILVITPGADADSACGLAERIRKSIEAHRFDLGPSNGVKQSMQFTVSIGVSHLTPTMEKVSDFLSEADRALYCAKENGRNCTMGTLHLPEGCEPDKIPLTERQHKKMRAG